MSIFKLTVREYRIQKHLTQKKLAILAGISQSYLSEIENNVKIPKFQIMAKIANALGIGMHQLIIPSNCNLSYRCYDVNNALQ